MLVLVFVLGPLAILALFFIAFALKLAFLEYRSRLKRPGGFEVKLTTGPMPVLRQKDNDHGRNDVTGIPSGK